MAEPPMADIRPVESLKPIKAPTGPKTAPPKAAHVIGATVNALA